MERVGLRLEINSQICHFEAKFPVSCIIIKHYVFYENDPGNAKLLSVTAEIRGFAYIICTHLMKELKFIHISPSQDKENLRVLLHVP